MVDSTRHDRRWTVIASGVLCLMLAVVVLFTSRGAFFSPIAVLVVAAIGLVAVLLQLSVYNRAHSIPVEAPLWLNVFGVGCALIALFADVFHVGASIAQIMALLAVGSFAISSAIILHAFRKRRVGSK